MTARRGASLAELVLVAWLFAFVLAAVGRFAAAQGRLSAAQQDRTRAAEAVRTAGLILEAEVRYLAAGDVDLPTSEWVGLRAARGGGIVCRSEGQDLLVRYRGVRLPNPEKDSVIIVTAQQPDGGLGFGLEGVAVDDACGGALRLTLSSTPPSSRAYVLIYERGSYHISGRALRYRLGAGGRQPLTETFLRGTGFVVGPSGDPLSLRLELDPDSLPRLGTLDYDLPLHQLNTAPPP